MTAAIKATGKIPFLYELGNQEIAIFMWCSREWKTNCLTKRKIYSVREAGRKLAAILSTCYIFDFSLFFARDIVTYWAMELDMAFSSPLSFIVYINQCLFVSRASSFHGSISHSCRPTLALPRGHSNTNKTPGSHLFCSRIWGQQVNLWFYWTKTRDNDELFCLFEVIRNPDLALENCGQICKCCVTFSNVIAKFRFRWKLINYFRLSTSWVFFFQFQLVSRIQENKWYAKKYVLHFRFHSAAWNDTSQIVWFTFSLCSISRADFITLQS